jgi:hypothetical protein
LAKKRLESLEEKTFFNVKQQILKLFGFEGVEK